MKIKYIDNPLYQVDFSQFQESKIEENLVKRVTSAANYVFKNTYLLSKAFVNSFYKTIKAAPLSFIFYVFGSEEELENELENHSIYAFFVVATFKATIFGLKLLYSIAVNTYDEFYGKEGLSKALSGPLLCYISQGIDVRHIQTNNSSIDLSRVSSDVKIDKLLTIFDKIEFNDENSIYFMPPTARQENNSIYSKESLKEGLETFIRRVNNKEPFLGTPPSYNMAKVKEFYQKIEDAVRFSIHTSDQGMKEFFEKNGSEVGNYSEEQLNQYKNLLEDRFRLVIDLAIAGKHCGARYMGESLTQYYYFSGQVGQYSENKTLYDELIDILANKRKEIAEGQIQQYLGSNTHSYSNYMASFGKVLALPGASNVVEHLSAPLSREEYLPKFFREYTEDTIIDAIQEKIKNSNSFRLKIFSWIKDQVGDWDKERYETLAQEKTQEILALLNSQKDSSSHKLFELFKALKKCSDKRLSIENFETFIEDLFCLKEVKEWRGKNYSKLLEGMQAINSFKFLMKLTPLSEEEFQKLKKKKTFKEQIEILESYAKKNLKIQEIQKKVKLDPSVIERLDKNNCEEILSNFFERERKNAFLAEMIPLEEQEKITEQGITSKLMEWLLVYHHIFLPQEVEGVYE